MKFIENVEGLFQAFNKHGVEYLIIGGVAVNIHGYSRSTGDLDVWYKASPDNFQNLLMAIEEFGFDTSVLKGISHKLETGFIRIPIDPFYVELISTIDGKLDFDQVHRSAIDFKVNQTVVKVIGYDHLIQNKIMSRRHKDLEDIAQLERRRKKN